MPDLIFVYLAPLIVQGLHFCTLKWTEILQTVQTHLWNQSSPQKKKRQTVKELMNYTLYQNSKKSEKHERLENQTKHGLGDTTR